MFTGIIEETGKIISVGAGRIAVQAGKVLEGTKTGDSIAVNGVCLTVTTMTSSEFTADVMPETLSRTNLGLLGKGACVNLERAMAADGRFGGHIVSGHIDGTGTVSKLEKDGNAVWVYIAAPGSILNLIIEKGSIAIDGISLTVAKVNAVEFAVSVIPHTGEETTLLGKKAGDMVNLENDVIGKYVQKLMGLGRADGSSSQAERDEKLLNWLK
ncbi:MAG: riboflavin synthase [Treponema sp.]|nr:riboflavin synthase [Treponema sp.]